MFITEVSTLEHRGRKPKEIPTHPIAVPPTSGFLSQESILPPNEVSKCIFEHISSRFPTFSPILQGHFSGHANVNVVVGATWYFMIELAQSVPRILVHQDSALPENCVSIISQWYSMWLQSIPAMTCKSQRKSIKAHYCDVLASSVFATLKAILPEVVQLTTREHVVKTMKHWIQGGPPDPYVPIPPASPSGGNRSGRDSLAMSRSMSPLFPSRRRSTINTTASMPASGGKMTNEVKAFETLLKSIIVLEKDKKPSVPTLQLKKIEEWESLEQKKARQFKEFSLSARSPAVAGVLPLPPTFTCRGRDRSMRWHLPTPPNKEQAKDYVVHANEIAKECNQICMDARKEYKRFQNNCIRHELTEVRMTQQTATLRTEAIRQLDQIINLEHNKALHRAHQMNQVLKNALNVPNTEHTLGILHHAIAEFDQNFLLLPEPDRSHLWVLRQKCDRRAKYLADQFRSLPEWKPPTAATNPLEGTIEGSVGGGGPPGDIVGNDIAIRSEEEEEEDRKLLFTLKSKVPTLPPVGRRI
eukprot:PhF_6_TR23930/c0_g1_i1/m.33490